MPTATYFSKTACDIWPNITGVMGQPVMCGTMFDVPASTGCFIYPAIKTMKQCANPGNQYWADNQKLEFNASRANGIFGKSGSIQPSSYRTFEIIKF